MVTIELSIFRSLFYDEEYCRKVMPYLETEYFDDIYKTLFNCFKDLYDKYNKVPTFDALAITIQKQSIGETEYEQIADFLGECHKKKNDLPDTDWLVDETEEYCKDKKIYNAIYQSIEIIEGKDKKLDKHAIPDLLDEALAISFDTSIGMEFFEDAEKRFEIYTSEEDRIKLPLDALMTMTNGGLKRKSLSCVMAPVNVGKSAIMCYLAGELLRAGYNVLYVSMEMSEELIHERVEANLLDISTDDLKKLSKDSYLSKVEKVKAKTRGRFFAKEYPTSSAHAGHFKNLIKELRQKKKFVADVIFIDYINICASSRYKSLSGVNSYSYVKAIAEEIRALAVMENLPIFTATQMNRAGFNDGSPDMTSTSESMGLPASLDYFMAVTQDEVLRDNGQQLFHLLKTRWGNKAKIRPQIVNINWDKMRYSDVNGVADVQNMVGQRKPQAKNTDGIVWDD